LVADWKDFFAEEVDENDESELLEWRQACDELMENLKVALGETV
jgi:hypothetical protein